MARGAGGQEQQKHDLLKKSPKQMDSTSTTMSSYLDPFNEHGSLLMFSHVPHNSSVSVMCVAHVCHTSQPHVRSDIQRNEES